MMTFDVILEDWVSHKLTFATIEDCDTIEECVNHIWSEFPHTTIEQIKEVNK